MDRLIRHKKNGGLKIDVSGMIIEKLSEYEDTGLEPFEIRDIELFYKRYKDAPNCNNCAVRNECKFSRDPGCPCVLNCPLWVDPSLYTRKSYLEEE